jgi:hypothetical protein
VGLADRECEHGQETRYHDFGSHFRDSLREDEKGVPPAGGYTDDSSGALPPPTDGGHDGQYVKTVSSRSAMGAEPKQSGCHLVIGRDPVGSHGKIG